MNAQTTETYLKKVRKLLPKRRKLEFQESYLGLEERWSLISPHLPASSSWILDVGSNMGDTARRAAELGHTVLGVEMERNLVERAMRMMPPNVALMIGIVDPEFFRRMPRFDVVLLLSVLHRIWAVRGRAFAEECLSACLEKVDRVIVEGAVRHERYTQYGKEVPAFESNNLEEGVRWHLRWFEALVPSKEWKISPLGHVPASKREPYRPLFLLTASK